MVFITSNLKSYPTIRNSNIEWLEEIPEHWDTLRLKYMTRINKESLGEKSDPNYEFFYVEIGNVTIEGLKDELSSLIFEEAPSRARRIVKKNDVLISTVRTYLKAITWFPDPPQNLIASTGFAVITPSKNINPNYLYFFIRSQGFVDTVMANSVGISYPAINSSVLANLKICFPPLNEQDEIVSYLNKEDRRISKIISKKLQLIELLQEKRQVLITQAVMRGLNPDIPMKDSGLKWLGEIPEHWNIRKLKHVANIVLGKMLTTEDKGNYHLKPYLRAKNINWEKVDISDVKEMWFSKDEMKKLRLEYNDLLVTEGGEVGRTAIWKDKMEECYIQNSVYRVTFKSEHNPEYFLYQFVALGKLGYFDSIVNRVSIAHLTREKLKEIHFIIPPKSEQNEIFQYVNEKLSIMDILIKKLTIQLVLIKEYRQTLISNIVTGKIDVRGEN